MGLFNELRKKIFGENNVHNVSISIQSVECNGLTDTDRLLERAETADKIRNRYRDIIDLHNDYWERYEKLYSVLLNGNLLQTPKAIELITLIQADIDIAPQWRQMDMEMSKVYERTPQKYYPAFVRMALVYEKRGEYENAISICQQAINMGFDNDKTKGGMQGRIARLCKKANLNLLDYLDMSKI